MVKRVNGRVVRRVRAAWCDVNDSADCLEELRSLPEVGVIALTDVARTYLAARLPNRVVTIPIHHCNAEGATRSERSVRTVVLSGDRFHLDRVELRRRLAAENLDLVEVAGQAPREAHCRALAAGDVAIAFGSDVANPRYPPELKPPLKLVNAGAFGLPFVAWPEPAFAGFDESYIPVRSLDEMVSACARLRDDHELHSRLSAKGLEAAKPFAITTVAARYLALLRDASAAADR